jgi:hypothetical protein
VESYTYDGTTSKGVANPANDGSRKGDPYDKSITTPVYGIVFKATDRQSRSMPTASKAWPRAHLRLPTW